MNAIFGKARFRGVRHMPQAPKPAAGPHRRALLAKVHLARKELALSEDDYRAILLDVAGRRSAADCNDAQLVAVVERFKARGWKQAQPKGRSGGKPADHRPAGKARALWISLYHLNAISDPSERALEAFARRQLGCQRMQWADQSMMFRLIEAQKAIAERNGWSQSTEQVRPEAVPIVLRRRLVEAILAKMASAGLVPDEWGVERAAFEFAGMEIAPMLATASELDVVAKAFGDRLREGARP